jgi:hypothetical protein
LTSAFERGEASKKGKIADVKNTKSLGKKQEKFFLKVA